MLNVYAATDVTEFDTKPGAECHHVGRGADVFKRAFRAGAIDALRRARRQLPQDTWETLEDLSGGYEHAEPV